MSTPPTKAVIPTAGLATRMRPATRVIPKAMLPIVDTPALQIIVEEAIDDEGVVVQVVFRGLAGFGDKVDSLLRRGIRGYRPEDQDDEYVFF